MTFHSDAFDLMSTLDPVINSDHPSSEIECTHPECIYSEENTICTQCGKYTQSNLDLGKEWKSYPSSGGKFVKDPSRVAARKVYYKGIHKDVTYMNFSDEVVSIADDIYKEVTKGGIKRANSRKSIIFACIFHAYKIVGKPQPRDKLLTLFNISKSLANSGLKFVNLNASRFSPIRTSYITVPDFIESIMQNISATQSQIEEAKNIYDAIPDQFHNSQPKSIASAVIFYWMKQNNIKVTLEEFSKLTDLSGLTIEKLQKDISKLVLKNQ